MAKRSILSVSRRYRTYNWGKTEKNPVIGKMQTVLQDAGLNPNTKGALRTASEISGLSPTTLDGWFFGDTINPNHASIMALTGALGLEETFVRKREFELEKEQAAAAKWLEQQGRQKKRATAKKKRNGGSA